MAQLGKTYEPVCSEGGKENLNQPYVWLGLEDPTGSGRWRLRSQSGEGETVQFTNWDENEGSE